MGQYRLEIASTGRAGCQNTECKKGGIKILKGELRLGTFVTIQDNQTWRWKHWGCVTPKQLDNIKDSIDNDLDLLDGLDELPEHDQERVREAFKSGHVADKDWRGDVEMNRPGMNGYRTPTHKKQMREEQKDKEAQQTEGQQDTEASPSKPAAKKRGRGKAAAQDANEDVEPAPKKTKRAAKVKKEESADDDDDHKAQTTSQATKKAPKKSKLGKNEVLAEEKPPTRKRRAAAQTKTVKVETEASEEAESSTEAVVKPQPASKGRKGPVADKGEPKSSSSGKGGRKGGKTKDPEVHSPETESIFGDGSKAKGGTTKRASRKKTGAD